MYSPRSVDQLHVGAVYYPEQWPEGNWEKDAENMARAGITTVRLAEFAWHKFEPIEGKYEFDWLTRALAVFERHGIVAILCTPTPTYPAWLHRKYPDIHQVRSNGQIKEFGQRQDACKNHAGYREHAMRITELVTKQFGNHPIVVAWQTDNELGCHGTARCYCANCEREFQTWLSKRFGGDIARLNDAWGTTFWSQEYNDFSEISVPRDTADRTSPAGQNPGLALDFYRFSSDVQVSFNRDLATIIRKNSPSRPVTHNLMGGFTHINYFHLAADLDVVSWDNYPFFQPQVAHLPPAPLSHDLMRGLKRKNVWIMEEGAGAGGWDRFFPTPEPGRMRLWAFQAIARGADFVSFFRWRSARYGTEQYWHGIVPHHGKPEARYEEVRRLTSDAKRITDELGGSELRSDVAIIYDYDSLWALDIQPHSMKGISYHEVASDYASAFGRLGIMADIIPADGDFTGYKLVVAPVQHVTEPGFAARLTAYVKTGGVAVIGARSSVKDTENAIHEAELPAGLSEVAGCTVADYDAFSFLSDESVAVTDTNGNRDVAHHLAELLHPAPSAATVLTYEGRYYSGRTAAVRNAYGSGTCYLLGTYLDAKGLQSFLRQPLADASVSAAESLDPAIETTVRTKGTATYRFYLNHDTVTKSVVVKKGGRELLSGAAVAESIQIAPLDVVIVREN